MFVWIFDTLLVLDMRKYDVHEYFKKPGLKKDKSFFNPPTSSLSKWLMEGGRWHKSFIRLATDPLGKYKVLPHSIIPTDPLHFRNGSVTNPISNYIVIHFQTDRNFNPLSLDMLSEIKQNNAFDLRSALKFLLCLTILRHCTKFKSLFKQMAQTVEWWFTSCTDNTSKQDFQLPAWLQL